MTVISSNSGARRRPPPPPRPSPAAIAIVAASVSVAVVASAMAQVPLVLQGGPPVQVQPSFPEPGVPLITITPGTANPFAGLGGGGMGGGGAGGTGGGSGGGGGGSVGGSDALTTMLGTPWGVQAVNAAQSLGVNPSAVAATCVLESGCRNQPANGGAEGVFQMFPAAFREGLNTALRTNPALASQVVQGDAGRFDAFTSSIAASGYLMQATQMLQQRGIENPTVLQTRGYYNFGPRYAGALASADPTTSMGDVLAGAPPSFFSGNGITPSTTVGAWRASVSAKIGNAANQQVRL